MCTFSLSLSMSLPRKNVLIWKHKVVRTSCDTWAQHKIVIVVFCCSVWRRKTRKWTFSLCVLYALSIPSSALPFPYPWCHIYLESIRTEARWKVKKRKTAGRNRQKLIIKHFKSIDCTALQCIHCHLNDVLLVLSQHVFSSFFSGSVSCKQPFTFYSIKFKKLDTIIVRNNRTFQ